MQNKSKASNRVWETEVEKERKKEWKNRGRETNRGCFGASRHRVCVCVCVSWEGTVGEFGGMEEGIRALGPAPQGTEKMGREWREGMGEGRRRVKGRDVVSSEFENSAGRDNKDGGRKRRRGRSGQRIEKRGRKEKKKGGCIK